MKSAIRKASRKFDFVEVQLIQILKTKKNISAPNEWVSESICKIDDFCNTMLKSHPNVDLISLTRNLESILSLHIKEKAENKELLRKKMRRIAKNELKSLAGRQNRLATYSLKLMSVRGTDPQMDSICEFLHLCRWGTKNQPISSSKRSAPMSSIESRKQKKELIYLIAELLKAIGLFRGKSLDNLVLSINTAYGHWNCHSIGGLPRTSSPHYSSRFGWLPNS